jgi:hypothetical protein
MASISYPRSWRWPNGQKLACGSGAVVSTWPLLIRRHQRACRQAEIPLIALSKFPRPALPSVPSTAQSERLIPDEP